MSYFLLIFCLFVLLCCLFVCFYRTPHLPLEPLPYPPDPVQPRTSSERTCSDKPLHSQHPATHWQGLLSEIPNQLLSLQIGAWAHAGIALLDPAAGLANASAELGTRKRPWGSILLHSAKKSISIHNKWNTQNTLNNPNIQHVQALTYEGCNPTECQCLLLSLHQLWQYTVVLESWPIELIGWLMQRKYLKPGNLTLK